MLAFVILAGVFMRRRHGRAAAASSAASRPARPAAGVLQPGDRIVAVDGKRGDPASCAARSQRTSCAGRPTAGCTRGDAGHARRSAATASEQTVTRHARSTTPGAQALRCSASRYARTRRATAGPGARGRRWRRARCGASPRRRSATIAQIFKPEKRKQISGVVGAYEMTRQAIELDATTALCLLALISLSLGVINLFPFLPLDGGHIFWALAEKVRGRAIPFSVMERAGFVGFALVIMLFVIGFTNDIGRLTGRRLRYVR